MASSTRRERPRLSIPPHQGVGLVVVYALARLSLALYTAPLQFPDSASYRWHGADTVRPYGISLLFSVLDDPSRIVLVQTVLSIGAWVWLFYELRSALGRDRWETKVAVGILALATLSGPISRWDRTVLSETLAYACIAALAAVWLLIRRSRYAVWSLLLGAVVFAVTALVRETVFLGAAIPMAVTVTLGARKRLVTGAVAAVLAVVFGYLALHPGSVVYDPHGASVANFRSMNVVGQRILPDPYLRRRMERAGLPQIDDVALYKPRFGMDDDWLLYRTPGVAKFATDFPAARYLVALASRPFDLTRQVFSAVDRGGFGGVRAYGTSGNEVIPGPLGSLLWGWTGPLHAALLAFAGLGLWQSRAQRTGRHTVLAGSMFFGVTMSAAAVGVSLLDATEVNLHALPFLVSARLAVATGLVVAAAMQAEVLAERGAPSLAAMARWVGPRVLRIGRPLVATIVVVGSVVATVSFARAHPSPGAHVRVEHASDTLVRRSEQQLREEGLWISPEVHRMLRVVLGYWEQREDLQAIFTRADGLPEVAGLTAWARVLPDSSTEGLAPYLAGIQELRWRMGYINDAGIVPVIYWTLQNERTLDQDFTSVMFHLADLWNERAEVRERFTKDGRVDVRGFLDYANNLPNTDPRFVAIVYDQLIVREAIHALDTPN